MHVSELRHLNAATAYRGRGTSNACVQWSLALALDVRHALMTFGTLRAATPEEAAVIGPAASRVPFIHCWVEVGDTVYAPTTIERTGGMLVPMSRHAYYDVNKIRDVCHVPRIAFDDIVRRYRVRAALKHLSPRFGNGDITGELLAAAGVRYTLGANRALLPTEG
jgi:hypothetical protein